MRISRDGYVNSKMTKFKIWVKKFDVLQALGYEFEIQENDKFATFSEELTEKPEFMTTFKKDFMKLSLKTDAYLKVAL